MVSVAPSDSRNMPPAASADSGSTPQSTRSYSTMSTASSSVRALTAHPSSSTMTSFSNSPGSHRASPASATTVELALANANGSYQTALENLVTERNSLQTQNVMLWKHLEKIKASSTSTKKDLERVRAERDRVVSLLDGASEDRKPRPPHHRSQSSNAGTASSQSHESPPSDGRPSGPSRHASDGQAIYSSPRRTRSPSLANDAAASSTSHNLMDNTPRASSRPLNMTAETTEEPTPHTPTTSSGWEISPSTHNTPATTIVPPTPTRPSALRRNPSPHITNPDAPPRRPLMSKASSSSTSTSSSIPTNTIPPASSDPPSRSSSIDRRGSGQSDQTYPLNLPSKKSSFSSNKSAQSVELDSQNNSAAPPQTPTLMSSSPRMGTGQTLTPDNAGQQRRTRESRISLPDEASRYITNMVDSPANSPRSQARFAAAGGSGAASRIGSLPNSPLAGSYKENRRAVVDDRDNVVDASLAQLSTTAVSPPPFLEMDEDEDDEDEDDEAPEPNQEGVEEAVDITPQRIHHPAGGPIENNSSSSRDPDTWSVSTRDPPLSMVTASTATLVNDQHQQSSIPTQPSFTSLSSSVSASSTSTIEPQTQAQSGKRYEYRSARLTSSDLPYTEVHVQGSNIRPNDRGKEVLSFFVSVELRGKEPWKVEKLYSDVLTLDARVRASIGKSGSKKLAPLPDNKLFKDNAPAKVDQRKVALEAYFQTLISAPFKKKDDICMFFSTDVVDNERAPVHQAGYKEGYLTKRGKNFGGFLRWKTRYFVLQSPVLEYYESRGGQHLGSITITNAQIGRQQKSSSTSADDENAFRHAFLIIEAKKGAAGTPIRHVLCSDSDAERDAWVEVLVRYVVAGQEEHAGQSHPDHASSSSSLNAYSQPRSSTSSSIAPSTDTRVSRSHHRASKDDLAKAAAAAVYETSPSPIDRTPSVQIPDGGAHARRLLEKNGGGSSSGGASISSSSLPTNLDNMSQIPHGSQRAASEMGHYPDLRDLRNPGERASLQSVPSSSSQRPHRASYHPSLSTVKSGTDSTSPVSPDQPTTSSAINGNSKVKISGPINGTPIPAGYKFGAKDTSVHDSAGSDRERKAKSGRFWGFGKAGAHANGPPHISRAVFGVTIQDSLAVAQIANLPAIVFRCIEYLEAKKAEQEEGIYRLSGSSAVIKNLKDMFNAEGDVNLLQSDEYWDPHAIAGLLKSYFRELPTSILTRDMHLRFLAVIDLTDPQERIEELSSLISALPLPNYCLLRALTAHLILIVQNSSTNKMTMRNVGIVFSPTLGIPAGVFSLMLAEFTEVFNVDADMVETGLAEPVAALEESLSRTRDALTGVHQSQRNSRSYAEGSADRLLGLTGRTLTVSEEEDNSDDDIIAADESGTETDTTPSVGASDDVGSPPNTPGPQTYRPSLDRPNGKSRSTSHSAVVAATRGLQIMTESQQRPSPPPGVGLPISPRPAPRTPSSSALSIGNTPR